MQSDFATNSQTATFRIGEISRSCRQLLRSWREDPAPRNHYVVLSEVLDGIRHNLRFDHLGLGFLKATNDSIEFILQAGDEIVPIELPVHSDSLDIVITDQEPIEVSDVNADPRFPAFRQRAQLGGFRSFRVVPLRGDQQTLGILCVQRRETGNFSPEDVQYLSHASQLIALALENAVMADVLRREKGRLETLLHVNAALISNLDVQKVLREISGLIHRVVNQDYTHLALYDQEKDAMKFYILESGNDLAVISPESLIQVSECPAGISYKRGEVLQFSHDDFVLIRSEYANSLLQAGIRNMCCFPLVSHGRKLGALGLASMRDQKPSQDDIVLLSQIAGQVAIAIDNARAYDEIAGLRDKLSKEKLYLEDEIRSHHSFGEVVGTSQVLGQVLKQVEIAAPSDATVLLLGETGTGKELFARALHRLSSRGEENFIKLNCAAIPTGLLESELFGHEKGAFTGAISQKMGRLELADRGTLFLDEIGEIPMELQPKLLRVLQDQEFERLGGVRTIRVNVRVIAATNQDLAQAVAEHRFRSDLYYRLNVFPIRLPPLRDRSGDIPLLVRYFVQKFARRMGKRIESIPVEVIEELEQWHWPGNIRELENFLERSVILTQGTVLVAPMAELRVASPDRKKAGTLEEFEREYILRTLRESGGVIAGVHGAAARLGMKRTTLQSRMQKLGITREEYEM